MTRNVNRLSQSEFFKACKALEEMSATFKAEQTSFVQASKQLGLMCGFGISTDSLRRIREATGIEWVAKKEARKNHNASRYIAKQIVAIQQALGLPVPERLAEIADIAIEAKKPLVITDHRAAVSTAAKVMKPDVVPVHVAGK